MEKETASKFTLFSPTSFIILLLVLVLGNLFIIDAALFLKKDKKTEEKQLATTSTPSNTPIPTQAEGCSTECKAEIQKAVADAIIKPQASTQSTVKEYFVPLGSGSSTSESWTDVPGVQSYIDSSSYGVIKSVNFEASLYTPTGNQFARARLYNVTDSHPVWNSEVEISGGTPQLKVSSPITLDKGSKLYQVQMLTQLGSRTNLENARLRITTR